MYAHSQPREPSRLERYRIYHAGTRTGIALRLRQGHQIAGTRSTRDQDYIARPRQTVHCRSRNAQDFEYQRPVLGHIEGRGLPAAIA